jgi:hypothetical protein
MNLALVNGSTTVFGSYGTSSIHNLNIVGAAIMGHAEDHIW